MAEETGIDIAALKRRLLDERAELEADSDASRDSRKPVELDQPSIGRLSRMDAMQVQEMAQESERRRKVRLQRIDAALKRVEDGEYGDCVSCGEAIAPQRLDFDPAVPTCIGCARGQD